MRIGQNPAKAAKEVAKPARITAAVLNYIPFLNGFYTETLDVLKVCLNSLRDGADLPYDLMVFDNGSCPEVVEYLVNEQQAGRIQYLLLSEKNLGKGGAWNFILAAAPGEIIAYSDSDALFYPGWLSKSVEVLETYPKVGMVTARPLRTPADLYSAVQDWAAATPEVKVEEGQLMSWEMYKEFAETMGYPEGKIEEVYAETRDVRLTYKGVTAYAGANHFQFVGWKSVLNEFVPFNMDRPMGQVRMLDRGLNERGYLRLMTADPLVQNMSNTLPPHLRQSALERPAAVRKRSLWDFPLVKKPLLWLYDRIFKLYNP